MQEQLLNQLGDYLKKREYSKLLSLCSKQQEITPLSPGLRFLRLLAKCKCDDLNDLSRISGLEYTSDYHFLKQYAEDNPNREESKKLKSILDKREAYKASLIDALQKKKESCLKELRDIGRNVSYYSIDKIKKLCDAVADANQKVKTETELHQNNTADLIEAIGKKAKEINAFILKNQAESMSDKELNAAQKGLKELVAEYISACQSLGNCSLDAVETAKDQRLCAAKDVNDLAKKLCSDHSSLQVKICELKDRIQAYDTAIQEVTKGEFKNAVQLTK